MISCRTAFGDNKIIIKIIYNVQAKVPAPHGRSEFANLTPGYNGGKCDNCQSKDVNMCYLDYIHDA